MESGTLNVELQEHINPPYNFPGTITFNKKEIPKFPGENYPDEGFTFIPIKTINSDKSLKAYVWRPEGTCHPPNIIEIIANVCLREKFNLSEDAEIKIEL